MKNKKFLCDFVPWREIIFFTLFFSFRYTQSNAQNFDIDLLRNIHSNQSPFFNSTFDVVAKSAYPVPVIAPLSIYAFGAIKKNNGAKTKAFLIGTSVASTLILNTSLKFIIDRERPYEKYSDIIVDDSAHTPSFPSGHTAATFSLATSLSLYYPKWYVIAPSFLWAGVVAYSRMYQGVHFPTDILGGMTLGIGIPVLIYHFKKPIVKFGKKLKLYSDYDFVQKKIFVAMNF